MRFALSFATFGLSLSIAAFAQSKAPVRSVPPTQTNLPKSPVNDWLIVPGVRIGPITAATTENDLRRIFGAASVITTKIDVGEGFQEPGTVLYGDDPSKALSFLWKGTESSSSTTVFICRTMDQPCRWHTSEGITLGTSLKTLEQINGKPFTMTGFGWDYSGTVMFWDDGKLDTHDHGRLLVRLYPLSFDSLTTAEMNAIQGDRAIPSSNLIMQKLNPVVYQVLFEFPQSPSK